LLPRWLREVPLYRGTANPSRFADADALPEELRRLPLVTKADMRRNFPHNFLREDTDLDALVDGELIEVEHTSGTSEEPIPLLLGKGWWAEQERRALRLNALAAALLDDRPSARRVTITSPVCSGDIRYTGTPSRAERVVDNALFVSLSRFPFLWGHADLVRMSQEISDWQPQFLDVDPAYGVVLALFCERQGIRFPSVRFILCSYEFVSVAHRRILQRVFGAPVFNLYGSTETGHLLMETTDGHMRPSLETAFLEIPDPDESGIGELAVTTLTNEFMPLIRYRIGDLVERRQTDARSDYVVHGRVKDAFTTPGGTCVTTWKIDQCFGGLPGFAHYQLRQNRDGGWLLRFVADNAPPGAAELEELRARLAPILEAADGLEIRQRDFLMPEASGKFRLGYPATAGPLHSPVPDTVAACK
jgi:phenylacetate-CoA ligase